MNLKKIFIFTLLIGTLASCSDNIVENISQTPVNNPEVITDKKIEKINSEPVLKNISLSDFKAELQKNDGIVIDLRTSREIEESGVILGAKQIDFYSSDFQNKLNSLDKTKKYLIYCRSGGRSGKTLGLMKNLGFNNVYELRGGMNGWLRNGEKTVKYNENISNTMDSMNENMEGNMMDMQEKVITLNAKKWEFDKKEIRVKKGEKIKIKVNNLDGLHGIAIPGMKLMDDNEIELDTSIAGEFQFQCLNYCGEGHANMTGKIIIE